MLKRLLVLFVIYIGIPLSAQTSYVSKPVGVNQITVPANDQVLVSLAFSPQPGELEKQLESLTEASIVIWHADLQDYVTITKAYNSGDAEKDGKWFIDINDSAEVDLDLLISTSTGFYLQNNSSNLEILDLCGEVVLSDEQTIELKAGLNLIGYSYSTTQNIGSSSFFLSGATSAVAADSEIAPDSINSEFWLNTDGNWYDLSGTLSTYTFLPNTPIWYSATAPFSLTTTRPYGNPFTFDYPNIASVRVNPISRKPMLTIDCIVGDSLMIFAKDISLTEPLDPTTGWSLIAQNIDTTGQTQVTWSDDELIGTRLYLVATQTDSDNDALPDAQEEFQTGTSKNNPDSDNDSLKDGEEVAAGYDPNDVDSDDDGFRDNFEKNGITAPVLGIEDDDLIKQAVEGIDLSLINSADELVQAVQDKVASLTGLSTEFKTFDRQIIVDYVTDTLEVLKKDQKVTTAEEDAIMFQEVDQFLEVLAK